MHFFQKKLFLLSPVTQTHPKNFVSSESIFFYPYSPLLSTSSKGWGGRWQNRMEMRTHTPACAHTQTLHTDTAGRRLANVVFFLRGMRWAVGEALTLTRERGAGGWSSFLLLSHNRGRGILVRCGLWREHTYLRALAYTLHTVRQLFITPFGGRPTSR